MATAIVTGGARGIGAAICARLMADGYEVVVLDRIKPEHRNWHDCHEIDLADSAKARELVAAVGAERDVVVLVNNAGIARPATLDDTTDEDIDAVLAVNIRGAIACTQAVVPGMRRAGRGRIVNIGSRTALGKQLRTAYSASKAGLIGLTKTWALELAQHGITVNCVAPGPIRTAAFDRANPADSPATQAIVNNIPVGFMGEPEDVAGAVGFFADARFVTGQVLYVCGGITLGIATI